MAGKRVWKFLAYLWGIETRQAPYRGSGKRLVFSVPMRNWNASTSRNSKHEFRFWTYLWAIETNKCKGIYHTNKWFLAYLWGIETEMNTMWFRGCWKKFLAYLWGIETSLLRFSSPLYQEFLAYLWGIETWQAHRSRHRHRHVFSVPMRNWNTHSWRSSTSCVKVFSVPMRNWNWAPSGENRQWRWFLAYLWGIETHILVTSCHYLITCF